MKPLMLDGPKVIMRIEQDDEEAGGLTVAIFDANGRHEVVLDRSERRRLISWLNRLERIEAAQ